MSKIEYQGDTYSNLPTTPCGVSGPFLRASGIGKRLEDASLLHAWEMRQVLWGLRSDPTVIDSVVNAKFSSETSYGKAKLNELARRAKDAAGSKSGAKRGTAFHTMVEQAAAGQLDVSRHSEDELKMIAAYQEIIVKAGVRPIDALSERVVVAPGARAAGRFDLLVEHDGKFKVADIKTNKSLHFSKISYSAQLAVYGRATWALDEARWAWEGMPLQLDPMEGIIIWVPSTRPGHAEIARVDLEFGWNCAQSAHRLEWMRAQEPIQTIASL